MSISLRRALTLGTLALLPALSYAGAGLFDPLCSPADCGPTDVRGTVVFQPADNLIKVGQSIPFVETVYGGIGECLWIEVMEQSADLEAVLVGPDGTVWRNDDRDSPTNTMPFIKAVPSASGWYTLIISNYNAAGPTADFHFQMRRYPVSDAQCAAPSDPVNL